MKPTPDMPESGDLYGLWRSELQLCDVTQGETFVAYTDPEFPYPEYVNAALVAARGLGANAYAVVGSPTGAFDSEFMADMWKAADMVVVLTLNSSWLMSQAHNDALAAGTRTLMVHEPVEKLRRMFPDAAVVDRTYAGAKRMARAREIRVTDRAGSDFTFRKDGRKGHAQVGVSDRPGRWDNWPSAFVACAPLENSAEGTYVISPGDAFLLGPWREWRHVVTPIRLTLHEGLITDIAGEQDAHLLRERLEEFNDPDAFRWSHAGWGTEHRANWDTLGTDAESKYGTVMVSIGRNSFSTSDELSGYDGQNNTKCHVDITCRHKTFYLDGELVVSEDEEIVAPGLG
jgi:2,5-dihydroxypyridine 5,6-dioxygenase